MKQPVRVPDASVAGGKVEDAEVALDDLVQELLARVSDSLGVDTVAVSVLDETEEALVPRAAWGLEQDVVGQVRVPLGIGVTGRVAASRKPVVVENVEEVELDDPPLRERGIRSLLGVPIEVEDKLLGVIHVGSLTQRTFTEEDVRLLEFVAGRVAVPIAQAQLYGVQREARRELEAARRHLGFLADASAVLASSLDFEAALAGVARLAVPELGDWCMIDVLAEDGSVQRVAVACADPAREPLADELRHTYPARPAWPEGSSKVLRTGRSKLVEKVTEQWLDAIASDAHQREILLDLGLRSNVLVPLAARGRTLGVLTLATAESGRRYDESELRVAEELAARAGLAVDNSRLFRDAEESVGLLDTLFATAPVGLAFLDKALRYRRVNDTLAALTGFPREEHIGRTTAEIAPSLADEIEGRLRQVLATGEPILDREVAAAVPGPPGQRFWLASFYPVPAADGETVGVGVVVTDLTERVRAERRLSAQYRVTRILSVATSLPEAAPQILEAMCESLEWEVGGFWSVARDGSTLHLLEEWHVPSVEPAPFTKISSELELASGEGLPGRVWRTGEPRWFRDVAMEPGFPRAGAARTVGLHSAFAFPVLLGRTVLGVLEFLSGERKTPDRELLQMAESVGSQIGQFIERTRAERERAVARDRLSFLAEANRLLASSPDYDATLQQIAELAVPALADWCTVEVLEHDATLRRVGLAHADPGELTRASELTRHRRPDPEALQGSYSVLRSGEPLLVPQVSDRKLRQSAGQEGHLRLLRELGFRSWIAAPLIARGRALGVLTFATADSGRTYDTEDLTFVEDLARRTGVAVDNARLFQAAVRNEEQQRFLADAGTALASSLDYRKTLQRLARLAVPTLADFCIVDVLVEGDRIQRVAVAAADEDSQSVLEELRHRFPPALESREPAARALREEKPVLIGELTPGSLATSTQDEQHYELAQRLAPSSAIAVPLVARGHIVGAITFVRAESGRRYTAADLPLAEEIARRAALALDNARLHRETEERARAALVLSRVGDGVFMLDQDDVVRLWNPAAEAITGLSAERVIGGRAEQVIPGWRELAKRIQVAPAPASAARRADTLPLEIGGREVWLSIAAVGLEEGTVYAFRDLTEEHALEKMRSDFVATISHELRTPLASIYGAAVTLVQRESSLDGDQRERLLGVIASEADRLARIVNEILLASRLDSQSLVFSIETCDALEALDAAVEAARAHLPKHLGLEVERSGGTLAVAADPDKLRQILGNLIDNAVKYSPDQGVIRVGAEPRGGWVCFSVADEGIGIAQADRGRIFEKFYRLDPELLRGVGGTGLGLYISRELVRRMGGRIWVESRIDTGSTFYFELPLAEASTAVPAGLGERV